MAEALMRQSLEEKFAGSPMPVEIRSAGIMAGTGLPATAEAIQVMAEYGIDLSRHRSRILNQKLLQWADLVLTMTESHRKQVLNQFMVRPHKIYTLAEFSGAERVDVVDPFGSGIAAYRQSARQLQLLIQPILERIL
jgi:protein-tyrosine-phosphatase